MKIYVIKTPHFSSTYSILYNKNIEIFETEEIENESSIIKRNIIFENVHTFKNGKIKTTKYNYIFRYNATSIYNEPINKFLNYTHDMYFSNFESALISKLLLLKFRKEQHYKRMQEISNKINKAIPQNLDEMIINIKNEHPEHFI